MARRRLDGQAGPGWAGRGRHADTEQRSQGRDPTALLARRLQKFGRRVVGEALGLDGTADGALHDRLKNGQPSLRGGVRRQGRAGGVPQAGGQFGREPSGGIGGMARQPQARTTWPSSRLTATSVAHDTRCASTRFSSISRRAITESLEASSRATSDPLTSERKSRITRSSPALTAASARSRHSAAFTLETRDSASASTPSVLGSGLPSSLAFSRSKWSAVRTAGIPPRRSCWAMGFCSAGSPSNMALRCVLPGLRRR